MDEMEKEDASVPGDSGTGTRAWVGAGEATADTVSTTTAAITAAITSSSGAMGVDGQTAHHLMVANEERRSGGVRGGGVEGGGNGSAECN